MPTSPARIAANQRNAQRSTGPKTVEGKNRSRLNAFRHGLAGSGDLVSPSDDLALVQRRTSAFIRELDATGEVGKLLARRAAVLSVRMETAADRDFKAVARAVQAGRAQFDDDRAEQLDAWVVEAEESGAPDLALCKLETCPEGLRYLRGAWRVLRAQVANGDTAAAHRAAHWLGPVPSADATPADLLPQIDAEITRLDWLVDSSFIADETRRICAQRDDAGQVAGFDPSPEAILARRYEAAAERGMYRAMREIRQLRDDATPAALVLPPAPLPAPPPAPTPPRATPPPGPGPGPKPAPAARPVASAPLGSFRADVPTSSAERPESPLAAPTDPRNHPDPARLVADRR